MENKLAARGQGLAGLGDELNQCLQIIVTNAGNIVSFNVGAFRDEDIHGAALAIEKAMERAAKAIRAALEAAAPAGTAPPEKVMSDAEWASLSAESRHNVHLALQYGRMAANLNERLLATPSPQAPAHAENCNSVLFNGPMGECDCGLRPSSVPVGEQK